MASSKQPPSKGGPVESTTVVSPFSGAPGGVKVGQVTSTAGGSTFVVGVYAEAVAGGGVQFWVQVESGTGDLRGFFLDIGTPGGPITQAGGGSNNMNGTGYTFDYGVEIGSPGSSDMVTKATFTLFDLPMMDLSALLDGATFGIRATGVGTGSTSVKLVGSIDLPEVTVSIAPSAADVLENAPAAFTVSLSMALDEDMLVTLSNGATVTIPKGSTSVPYVNGTQGDDVYIDPGQISVSISSAVPQGPTLISVNVDSDPAVVNVTDTIDPVTVKLSATPSTSEDGGSITYTVRLEKSGGTAVTTANAITVTLANGEVITIPAGASTADSAPVAVNRDDVIREIDAIANSIASVVEANAGTPGAFENLTYDSTPVSTQILDDSDPVTVKLSATPSTSEDGGSITYTVRLEKSGGTAVTTANAITVTLANGEVITIPAGASTADSAPVAVNRDDVWVETDAIANSIASVVEANAGTPGAFESLIFDTTPVSTQVLDDVDPVTVGIYNNDGERDPSEPAIFRITIDQPLDSPLQVALSTGDTITIPAGSTEYLYTVNDPPLSLTVEIDGAVVTGKTFESLVISPDSATITDPPPDEENFPTLENNISHITIYFSAAAGSGLESIDTNGGSSSGGKSGPDGLYTVKIDWLDADTDYKDLDDVWDAIYARLLEVDPNLVGKAVLGVAIKAGSGEQFYALDGDEDVDTVPLHTVDGMPSNALVVSAGIDRVYTSDTDADGRNDFFEPAGGYVLSGMTQAQDSAPV